MDLSSLEPAADGATMPVRHPATGAVIEGMSITFLGMDSEIAIRQQRAATNKRLRQGVHKMKWTAEELDEDGLQMLAALTVRWEEVELDGAELPCNRENAAKLYKRFRWLREQADEFVGERANFLQQSQTS